MIDCIIEFSIRNRFLVIGGAILLAVWGVFAVYHTPIDAIPDLSENQVIVFTEWMGHSPKEIEDQVTYPLSLHLQGVKGVRVVRSSSDFNFSMINVIFEDSVGFYAARQQVAERLARAAGSMPAGVTPALAPDAVATGQIFWYTVEGGGLDLGELRGLQDWYIRPQLSSVPGVAEVASVGGHAIEYQINVNPVRLQTLGATLPEVMQAVARSNSAVGGHVIQKANAEYVVRGAGWIGQRKDAFNSRQALRDLEALIVPLADGRAVRLSELAKVSIGAQFRRGILEKDGAEATGGVVLMRYGENPLEVTERLKQKILELQVGLPSGVRLVPFYDRTPLIHGAVATVTTTLLEATLTATICVLLVLLHFRTSFIIAVTLPLATLASFVIMWLLRWFGIADIQTNIMSLAGIAISIGVLVDASIVMAENSMHCLKSHFGDQPARGDIRQIVEPACKTVGRPIFFSVVIMLLSFLPVFALGGIEGKMFHPLAFTKSFALVAVALLAITLVPALCTVFIKGRLRSESESWLVRGVIEVYRPVLDYSLRRPAVLIWFIGITFLVGFAPLGNRWVLLSTLVLALVSTALVSRSWQGALAGVASLVVVALIADGNMQPLGRDFMTPLDEGMTMDMPITVPRASVTQAGDDLKARDMVFCRFPEVDMVVGKAGRAETPTDPAPVDMIETMVNFRPVEFWPKRKLRVADAERQAREILEVLISKRLITNPPDSGTRESLVAATVQEVLPVFDAQLREFAYQKNQEFQRDLSNKLGRIAVQQTVTMLENAGTLRVRPKASDLALISEALPAKLGEQLALAPALEDVTWLVKNTLERMDKLGWIDPEGDPLSYRPNWLWRGIISVHMSLGGRPPTFFTRVLDVVKAYYRQLWKEHVEKLNGEIFERAVELYSRLVLEELLVRGEATDTQLAVDIERMKRQRRRPPVHASRTAGHHHKADTGPTGPGLEPLPALIELQAELGRSFAGWVLLWRKDRSDLAGFGGELDLVMQMPGWTNVWTMPIQNRVDMLSTGVNTAIGVRVLGRRLEDVVEASEAIAAAIKRIPGAADVVADPVRGKGYLEIAADRERAARLGVNAGDVNDIVETALGGKLVTTLMAGRERYPVRIRYPRDVRESEESVRNLLVPAYNPVRQIPLSEVADVRISEGPAAIKSENGLLRNYVRLNVRGKGLVDFMEEAKQVVARNVQLPPGTFIEWTGQFEHELRARQTLLLIVPLVVVLILLILYWTYHDWADAVLMLLAVPGAIAGGVFFQWLFGYRFSVTVWVGYIACFGMATSTGIIMLVYLRQAVDKAGGLANMTLEQLKQAVMDGAVHRLRPKLLTEGTTVIGLAPLLWATGTGAEVIKPMAAPVLGGILIADEVIDLLLPVLFYWLRRWRWHRLHHQSESVRKGV